MPTRRTPRETSESIRWASAYPFRTAAVFTDSAPMTCLSTKAICPSVNFGTSGTIPAHNYLREPGHQHRRRRRRGNGRDSWQSERGADQHIRPTAAKGRYLASGAASSNWGRGWRRNRGLRRRGRAGQVRVGFAGPLCRCGVRFAPEAAIRLVCRHCRATYLTGSARNKVSVQGTEFLRGATRFTLEEFAEMGRFLKSQFFRDDTDRQVRMCE